MPLETAEAMAETMARSRMMAAAVWLRGTRAIATWRREPVATALALGVSRAGAHRVRAAEPHVGVEGAMKLKMTLAPAVRTDPPTVRRGPRTQLGRVGSVWLVMTALRRTPRRAGTHLEESVRLRADGFARTAPE